jgi:hypothetical protein
MKSQINIKFCFFIIEDVLTLDIGIHIHSKKIQWYASKAILIQILWLLLMNSFESYSDEERWKDGRVAKNQGCLLFLGFRVSSPKCREVGLPPYISASTYAGISNDRYCIIQKR